MGFTQIRLEAECVARVPKVSPLSLFFLSPEAEIDYVFYVIYDFLLFRKNQLKFRLFDVDPIVENIIWS